MRAIVDICDHENKNFLKDLCVAVLVKFSDLLILSHETRAWHSRPNLESVHRLDVYTKCACFLSDNPTDARF